MTDDDSFFDDSIDFMVEPTLIRGAEELRALERLVDVLDDYRRAHLPGRGDRIWNDLWVAVGEVIANRVGATIDRYELAMDLGDTESAAASRRHVEPLHTLLERLCFT